jgi:MoaA/NifB/PqqE/SkfB family radical SAM enzyme
MDSKLTPEKVRAAIRKSAERGSYRLILTGGEPTLSPDLLDHVGFARGVGFGEIELQTNAVLLDKPGAAQALRDAGLTNAQVSLHGPDSAISDRLTAAPGTHQRTLKGVDNLLAAGAVVLLNHLVFKDNCHLLVDFVEMVHARWSAFRPQLTIQFHSARNEFADRDEALRHVARYSDYAHTLRRAIDRARELGYRIYDLQDPTGIPSLCVLGADDSYLGPILKQAEAPRIHEWERGWFTRVAACERCEAADACVGVPRHYLALHGDDEFRPLSASGLPLRAASAPSPASTYQRRPG